MLTQFTSYDEIRAALGVAPEEIEDSVLSMPNYELVLQFDFEEIDKVFGPLLEPYYLTLVDSGHGALTTAEARFVSILRVYATYVIARYLLISLSLFAPVTIKDAKTEVARESDPYAAVREGVNSFYLLMRGRLVAAYLVLFPLTAAQAGVAFTPLSAVGLASDPVLGT